MKLKELFVSMFLIVFTASAIGPPQPAAGSTSLSFPLDDVTRRRVVGSTVEIVMYEEAAEGTETEVGSQGLGTLVSHDGDLFVVTHDHWSYLTASLKEVEFRNARGDFVLVLDAAAFQALIRYRDGGTMILQAPDGLTGVTPANAGAHNRIAAGDLLWLARYSRANGERWLEVAPAVVEAVERDVRPPRLQLRMPDGHAAIPGDSGGGVWFNGQLVGNVSANGLKLKRSRWSAWFARAAEPPMVVTIAALLPEQSLEAVKAKQTR